MNEQIINNLALGKLDLALEEAKSNGYHDLAQKIDASLLKTKESHLNHYEKPNGRIAGAQLANGWGLDGRQICALEHVKALNADNLLDIGCADGSFIFNCLHNGAIQTSVGVDAWKEGIDWATKFGNKTFPSRTLWFQGLFETCTEQLLTLNPFKAIHVGEVLEHVLNPVDILKAAKNLLASGGGIVVTVPIKRPPITTQEKEILTSGEVNEHIRYIDFIALQNYAKECNLRIVRVQQEGTSWVNLIATLQKID